MKKIARYLPYFILEKWAMEERNSTLAHIKTEKGFKHQTDEGLEVQLWEAFAGVFICKSEHAMLKTKHDNLIHELEKIDKKLVDIESKETQ